MPRGLPVPSAAVSQTRQAAEEHTAGWELGGHVCMLFKPLKEERIELDALRSLLTHTLLVGLLLLPVPLSSGSGGAAQ